jgi:hypothetical protein
MDRIKPHIGGDLRPIYLLYNIFSNISAVETLATMNIETEPKLQEQRSRHTLREDVRELGCHRHVQDTDITDVHVFPHKMEVDLDMFRVLVLNKVGEKVDDTDVVAVEKCALCQRSVELLK